MKNRCDWAKSDLMIAYHDAEWGVPVHDDRRLFEFLILEGAQAGLSWEIVLRKREHYRAAFDDFDYEKIAVYDDAKCAELLTNENIIRNRLKINSTAQNARAFLKIREEFGSFDKYIWNFVGGEPIDNKRKDSSDIPAKTEISDAISKDLKNRGFNFVGSTIIYAFMQACGLVNDHLTNCFSYNQLK